MPESSKPTTAPPGSPALAGSGALSDRELVCEILTCLRVNLMRETLTTQNDAQFRQFIEAWGKNQSAINGKHSNAPHE